MEGLGFKVNAENVRLPMAPLDSFDLPRCMVDGPKYHGLWVKIHKS